MTLLACTFLIACGASRHAPETHGSETFVAPTSNSVTLVGRFETLASGDAVRFAWPNSAMGFRFDGDAIGIVLAEDGRRTLGSMPVNNMYEVVVDGEVLPPIRVTSTSARTFTIDEGLTPGPHTAWVIKRTEGMVGSGLFFGLDLPQGTRLLPPPPRRDRRIEVYGASNEAAYGNLGKSTRNDMCNYTTDTQNAVASYPALVAAALHADLVNISFSGKGMVSAVGAGDVEPLPALADRIDPLYPRRYRQAPETAPHVVVVTLGANDFARGTPNKKRFLHAYGAFLHKLRKRYPGAAIICTVTPMIHGEKRDVYEGWIREIVASAHDARVTLLVFPAYTGETFGCDFHPDEALHLVLAQRLQAAIQEVTGWQ